MPNLTDEQVENLTPAQEGELATTDFTIPAYQLALVPDKNIVVRARVSISNTGLTVKLARQITRNSPNEKFIAVFLDSTNKVTGCYIQEGTLHSVDIYLREVFQRALLVNAATLLMVHNHPGRSLRPSDEDIKGTKIVKDMCKLLNIHLLDSIIISQGRKHYFSFRENARGQQLAEAMGIVASPQTPQDPVVHPPLPVIPTDYRDGIFVRILKGLLSAFGYKALRADAHSQTFWKQMEH